MKLKNKIVIVTGAGSGFGEGIARKFAAQGATVMVADIVAERARTVAESLPTEAQWCEVDVAEAPAVQHMVELTRNTFGNIDILINNAGMGTPPQNLELLDERAFDRLLCVNMKSLYLTSRAVVPIMKHQKSGVILNIASTAGVSPRPGLTWYNASKGWVITATRSMAVELAPFGIRVNALNPVAGETPLLKTFMGGDTPELRKKFLSSIPLGRFSTPGDMGNAACFLCSDEASMITGVALEVDGGRCI